MSRRILANKEEVNNSKPRQSFFAQASNKSSNGVKPSKEAETITVKAKVASKESLDTSLARQLMKESFEKLMASNKREVSEAMKQWNREMLGLQENVEKRLSEDEQRTKHDLERVQKESVEEVSKFRIRMSSELDLLKKRLCELESVVATMPAVKENAEEAKEMISACCERTNLLEVSATAHEAYSERFERDQKRFNEETSEKLEHLVEKDRILYEELRGFAKAVFDIQDAMRLMANTDEDFEGELEELEDDEFERFESESEKDFKDGLQELEDKFKEESEDRFGDELEGVAENSSEEELEGEFEEDSEEINLLEQEENAEECRLSYESGPEDGSIVVRGGLYRGNRLIRPLSEEEVRKYWLKTNRNSRGVEIKLDDSNS